MRGSKLQRALDDAHAFEVERGPKGRQNVILNLGKLRRERHILHREELPALVQHGTERGLGSDSLIARQNIREQGNVEQFDFQLEFHDVVHGANLLGQRGLRVRIGSVDAECRIKQFSHT